MSHNWTEADIIDMELKGTVGVEWQTPTGEKPANRMNDAWTQTEIDFATEYLEPRLVDGLSLAWWPQPKFRLPFMVYTPDFAELSTDGRIYLYEIKGRKRLGSAGRSYTAQQALRHFIAAENVIIYRVTRQDDGSWKFKTITNKRQKGPHTRAEVNE